MNLWVLAVSVSLLNLPFGYWRANVRKLSPQWFVSVHAAVPVVVALRILTGLGWELIAFPVLFVAYLCGQLLGGRLHSWWKKHATIPATSCLVMDVTNQIKGILT